jgi:hypothetical protein
VRGLRRPDSDAGFFFMVITPYSDRVDETTVSLFSMKRLWFREPTNHRQMDGDFYIRSRRASADANFLVDYGNVMYSPCCNIGIWR